MERSRMGHGLGGAGCSRQEQRLEHGVESGNSDKVEVLFSFLN